MRYANFGKLQKSKLSIFPERSPAKCLPLLEWNGKQVYGSDAIARLVAKLYNLAGNGVLEQAEADTIIGVMRDFGNIAITYIKGVFALDAIDKVSSTFLVNLGRNR